MLLSVVVPENETLLKELTVLAEGAGGTVEVLEDGRGYLTQLPQERRSRPCRDAVFG